MRSSRRGSRDVGPAARARPRMRSRGRGAGSRGRVKLCGSWLYLECRVGTAAEAAATTERTPVVGGMLCRAAGGGQGGCRAYALRLTPYALRRTSYFVLRT